MSNLKYKHTAYTSAQWASLNPVIVENEIVIESDTKRTKIGNGISTYNELEYADANSVGNSLGSIKPTDAAPTPARNGNYTFSIGGDKPAWLTAEAGITTVKAGDGVAVVYTAPSTYTYTHLDMNSALVLQGGKESKAIKSTISDLSIKNNLISIGDVYTHPLWSSGSIVEIGNREFESYIKTDSVGAYADWQAYYTVFLKKTDLEKKGIDFNSPVYLDFNVGVSNGNTSVWIILRYGIDDSKSFYISGVVDAVFNKNGSFGGLNKGDTTTWTERVIDSKVDNYNVSNFLVPSVYKGKNLYAVMLCVSEQKINGFRTSKKISINKHGIESADFLFDSGVTKSDILELATKTDLLEARVDELEASELIQEEFWAACGDSITNANHGNIYDIAANDPYMPIDGYAGVSTYKRKNYAYYAAKENGLKWANYGWGGTTLTHCVTKAYGDRNGFVDSRMQNLKAGVDWDYISIFFGWNDNAYGPIQQRDLWLQQTYGEDIGYPVTPAQIGTTGFATQAQKDACDAVVGVVDGVNYTTNVAYFHAKFRGAIDSTDPNTWCGAWNIALEYLMKKYTKAKFLIVAPFLSEYRQLMIDSVISIANKWGVSIFNFEDIPYWYYRTAPKNAALVNPDDTLGKWYTENGYACEATVNGYNQARMSYDSLHPSNLGYKKIYKPIYNALVNK